MAAQQSRDRAPYPFQSRQRILKRSRRACDRCRSRKCKCDGESPCYRCIQDSAVCIFGDRNENTISSSEYTKKRERRSSGTLRDFEQLYSRTNKEEENDAQDQGWTPDTSSGRGPTIQISNNHLPEAKKVSKEVLRDFSWIAQTQKSDGQPSESPGSCQGGSQCSDLHVCPNNDEDFLVTEDGSCTQTSPVTSEENRTWDLGMKHEIGCKNAVMEDELWVANSTMWRGIDLSIFDDMNLV